MPDNPYFSTPDTVLAATICYQGYMIDHCEQDDYGKVLFFWKTDAKIPKMLLKFAEGKVAVEPRRWHSHYKQVRERMRDYGQSRAVTNRSPWS